VVNFITRKDFQGVEIQGRYGISSEGDGEEKNANLAAGFGNYDRDGYNVLFAFDYFKRDPIFRKDRDISKSVDGRRFGVGDGRSSFAPQGNYVDPDTGAYLGNSVQPCPPELYNGRCRYDFNSSLLTLYNGADRYAGMVVGNVKLMQDLKLTGQLTYAHAKDHFEAHPVPDYFVVPTGSGLIAGRFMQGGPRITDRKSELFDANVGLEGTTKWFDWDIAVGHGESKVTNSDSNYYDANLWAEATGSGALDPTVNTNDAAFVNSLKVSPVREGKSKVDFVDLRARGAAFNLPAGQVGWALGTSFWKEHLSDNPDPLTQAGEVVGSIQQAAVDASRRASAVFAEVNVPILKNLELQGAVRYDHYPHDSKTSPKIGVYWTPLKELAFRASYTESFRVPSLKQLFGSQEQGAGDISEDQDCVLIGQAPGCNVAFFQVSGANPDLKPEKGKTWNLGMITDLGPFSASIDWWQIDKDDAITQPTITSALQNGLFTRDTTGRLLVFTNLQNVAQAKNEGIDVDMRLRIPNTLIGNVTLRDAATYYIKQRTREVGGEWSEFNGTYALPRWRNVFSIGTEFRSWEGNIIARTVGGFIDTPNPWIASDPSLVEGVRHVASHEEWDLSAAYTGFKNIRLSGGIINVFDRQPPLSTTNLVNNQYEQVGFAPLYTARGRFFHVEASYTFK
jgi:iron complex outermembrane receptor protein